MRMAMEYLLRLASNHSILLGLAAGLLLVIWTTTSRGRMKKKNNTKALPPPEVTGAWPLIGHLRLLSAGKQPLARTLGAMADEYGPIFSIRVGMHRSVVISSWETAMDSFSTNDKILSNRPSTCAGKYMGYEYAVMPFAHHGPLWRSMRKLVVGEMLSNNTLEKLKPVWTSELHTNLKELYASTITGSGASKPVDISEWFKHMTLNLIVKLISGGRYKYKPNRDATARDADDEETSRMGKAFSEFMRLTGELVPGDAFYPTGLVRWMDFGGAIAAMKQSAKDLDDIFQKWIDEHVERRSSNAAASGVEDDRDFIDALLSVTDREFESVGNSYTRETIIKAALHSVLVDGADTLGLNLEWVLSNLLNNPIALKKVQEEINTIIGGNERWVQDSDIEQMVYLQAAVKESMRLYPTAPLLSPHKAIEDCTIGGYAVTKGTVVYPNVWKIQRDPRVWSEPEKFSPERFLGHVERETDPGRYFGFIPFGFGRRSCPGNYYALKVTHLTIARLIQGFNVTTPGNMPVDMLEGISITLTRANPLKVFIAPRLSSSFYE
ncbi:unnamed protein product [Cuscuta europaea]|uniref:Uncharacterized protein n=1 Tax=Cuscuta europaea TaxID=41803 RepID=A0A9P1E2M2_CUSEU|nr:unnamed protein product [Cuscuta europaea]